MTEAMKLQKYSIKYELERQYFCIFLLIVMTDVKHHEEHKPGAELHISAVTR
jgi:hypothetical protein